jgi:hypothetical protein
MHAISHDFVIAEVVGVRQSGTRSVNIERDLGLQDLAHAYVLTAQGRQSLARILEKSTGQGAVRAWTLTGPYGTGKSYFSLFLMNLLSSTLETHALTLNQLERVDSELAQTVVAAARLDACNGYMPIAMTGYRAPIQDCLRTGLRKALQAHAHHSAIHDFLINSPLWADSVDTRVIVEAVQQLLTIVTAPDMRFRGLVLIIDELGKPLEFAAAHPMESDLFLLQELAELANRSSETPLILVGVLHQSFERYTGHADSLSQREWAKIQGRFEDIVFLEPPNQQLWLLANALEYKVDQEALRFAWPHAASDAQYAFDHELYPSTLRRSDFSELCERTLPFHPSAMVALPYLFRRLAQNERSMFAYLTSLEPRGFQEFIAQRHTPDRICLADLFDYVAANFQGRLYSSLRARALTETMDKIESDPLLEPVAVDTLKTIGLLSWLAEVGPFQASLENILYALRRDERSNEEIQQTLRQLQQRSTIVFRRFNHTYAIWQGSDVDIDERIEEARQRQLSGFSVAQAAQRYVPPQPIVARRHSFETGFTRYFTVRYVDSSALQVAPLDTTDSASGTVLLCLSASTAEIDGAIRWAQGEQFVQGSNLVVGVLTRTPRLAEILKEIHCLNWVHDNTPGLRDDAVARRELRTRLNDLETLVRNELDNTLRIQRQSDTLDSRWFHCGNDVGDKARRGLSALLSLVCDQLYADSPIIRNEILNRSQLSSQGAAARRNLIEGMLLRSDKPLLGIEGFPPERSMYESLLWTGRLHVEVTDRWEFAAPQPNADPLRLLPVWTAIGDYVFAQPPTPRNVQELFTVLAQPPYGLTDGVAPVLLCAFLTVHAHETTLYNEGTLLPAPDVADWEVLLRRPELFAVAGCRIVGPRLAIVERLARGLRTEAAAMPIVRELLRQIKSLPDHTLRTQRLSPQTCAVRAALDQARSPETLLFHDLPLALEVKPFAEAEEADSAQVKLFFDRLNSSLQELAGAMPGLLAEARDALLVSCNLPPGDEGWREFAALATELSPKINEATLSPLLLRARGTGDVKATLESTVAYVVNRPPRTWSDGDREQYLAKVQTYGELFQRARNSYATQAMLTPSQRERSRHLVEKLRRTLQDESWSDTLMVRVALQMLLEEYRQETEDAIMNGALTHD